MSEHPRKKGEYLGRVQYRLVKEEVEEMLTAGRRALPIYRDLVAAGKLNISYSTFCDYVRGNGERRHRKKKKTQVSSPAKKEPAKGKYDKSAPFFVEKLSLEELI